MSDLLKDQHFLKNQTIIKKIIKASEITPKDTILEIGPGKGILTLELSKKAKKVIAVEVDIHLKKYLQGLPKNVFIIYDNILNIINKVKFNKIVSNIPYSISEPLFKKMLNLHFDKAVLLVGKNFYYLISNKESKWLCISKIFFDIKKIEEVSKNSFEPKPRVNSVLLTFKRKKSKLNKSDKIIKEFVLQSDKKVKNALMYSLMRVSNLTKNQSKDVICSTKIPSRLFEKNVDYLSNKQFLIILKEIQNL